MPQEAVSTRVRGVTLRPEGEDDVPFLARLYATTRADELAVVPWDEEQKTSFLEMQFTAQRRHYLEHFADARFDVIERDGERIGRLYVDRRPDELRIIDIALLPEHRGAGLGGALMGELLEEAARDGKAVRIHVEQHNPALRLYERLGFAHVDDHGVHKLMEWAPPGS